MPNTSQAKLWLSTVDFRSEFHLKLDARFGNMPEITNQGALNGLISAPNTRFAASGYAWLTLVRTSKLGYFIDGSPTSSANIHRPSRDFLTGIPDLDLAVERRPGDTQISRRQRNIAAIVSQRRLYA